MTSTTTHVPSTSDDAVDLVLLIQEKLERRLDLLLRLEEDASNLVELLLDHQPFLRFNTPLINAAGDLSRAISSDVEASKQVSELLELMDYADRKDG